MFLFLLHSAESDIPTLDQLMQQNAERHLQLQKMI